MEHTQSILLTKPRTLPKTMRAYRIGDRAGQHPVFSAEGAKQEYGRWHETGAEVIYSSENYSTAMLEKLVYWNGNLPSNHHFVEITIPKGTRYEVVAPQTFPECFSPDGEATRRFGRQWYSERRSAVLIVPSVVARMERNVLINCGHPDFAGIRAGLETPVWWDRRLFQRDCSERLT